VLLGLGRGEGVWWGGGEEGWRSVESRGGRKKRPG